MWAGSYEVYILGIVKEDDGVRSEKGGVRSRVRSDE